MSQRHPLDFPGISSHNLADGEASCDERFFCRYLHEFVHFGIGTVAERVSMHALAVARSHLEMQEADEREARRVSITHRVQKMVEDDQIVDEET